MIFGGGIGTRAMIKKTLRIIGVVALSAILIVAAASALGSVFQNDRQMSPWGTGMFVITSRSMEPSIPIGSLIFVRSVRADRVRVGDVLTFFSPDWQIVVTHRVSGIDRSGDEPVFTTRGDANDFYDPLLEQARVIGLVYLTVPGDSTLLRVFNGVNNVGTIIIAIGVVLVIVGISSFFKKKTPDNDTPQDDDVQQEQITRAEENIRGEKHKRTKGKRANGVFRTDMDEIQTDQGGNKGDAVRASRETKKDSSVRGDKSKGSNDKKKTSAKTGAKKGAKAKAQTSTRSHAGADAQEGARAADCQGVQGGAQVIGRAGATEGVLTSAQASTDTSAAGGARTNANNATGEFLRTDEGAQSRESLRLYEYVRLDDNMQLGNRWAENDSRFKR